MPLYADNKTQVYERPEELLFIKKKKKAKKPHTCRCNKKIFDLLFSVIVDISGWILKIKSKQP